MFHDFGDRHGQSPCALHEEKTVRAVEDVGPYAIGAAKEKMGTLLARYPSLSSVALREAIGKMPPLWKKILLLRYYRDRTQQQTAEALGLSQVKISREEKKILSFLRGELIV